MLEINESFEADLSSIACKRLIGVPGIQFCINDIQMCGEESQADVKVTDFIATDLILDIFLRAQQCMIEMTPINNVLYSKTWDSYSY